MIVADGATLLVLGLLVGLACLAAFTIAFLVVAIANLVLLGVRELAYRSRRRRRSTTLYGPERRR